MKGIKKPKITKIKADEIRLLDDRTHVRLKRGMYIDNNQSANIQIITYNGTTFSTAGLATYGGEIV